MPHFEADLVDVGHADRFEAIRSRTPCQRNGAKRVVDTSACFADNNSQNFGETPSPVRRLNTVGGSAHSSTTSNGVIAITKPRKHRSVGSKVSAIASSLVDQQPTMWLTARQDQPRVTVFDAECIQRLQ